MTFLPKEKSSVSDGYWFVCRGWRTILRGESEVYGLIAGRVEVRNLPLGLGGYLRCLDVVGEEHALGLLFERGRLQLDQLLVLFGQGVELVSQLLGWGE